MKPRTRRHFLNAAAQGVAAATLAGCASEKNSDASRAEIVVDTHTHFYDPSRPEGVPWPSRDDKLLYRTVLPKEYRAQPIPHAVSATVVVEASPWLNDNQWILDLAANDPFIVGFVGNLSVASDEFAANLKRFAANKLFRGIRIGARKDDLAGASPLLRDLKLLADRNLALDLLGGQEILTFADRISARVPELRIVIDHLAGVRVDGKTPPADWIAGMKTISKRPNIFCKISGLVENTGHADGAAPRDVQYYAPVLDVMTDLFTPARLVYASNWPVSARFATLATVQSIVEEYFARRGQEALANVMWRSGKRAYGWSWRA
jgi:L-fuconolactonase